MNKRAIIHVDMDAFFASVEQRDDPSLRGRPVIVGGTGNRGVVAAASYEARVFGVRSAMPAARARKLCPGGIFVRARHQVYRNVSAEIFEIFHRYTPQVEGLSLDEAFLDVTGSLKLHGSMEQIGHALKTAIARETGLTASVGMAGTKLVAKLASDYDKPDGFTLVRDDEVRRFLDPMPVRRLPGVGPSTEMKLHDAGLLTVGQLRQAPTHMLSGLLGQRGRELAELAAGMDARPVNAGRPRRSISQETTFDEDLHDLGSLGEVISRQSGEIAGRLVDKGLHARTVHLKIRSGGFSTLTRSHSLNGYTRDAEFIAATAMDLMEEWTRYQKRFSIRLVGVGVSGLESRPPADEVLDRG